MTPEKFEALKAQGYNRIPVVREVLADLDTPLSAYLKLADGPYSYLFESVQGGEKWGRYSIIGLPCRTLLEVYGSRVRIKTDGETVEEVECTDPLAFIEAFQQRFRVADHPDLPRFTGGLVGYFGYDTIRYIEPKLAQCPNPDPIGNPDILLLVSDEVVVFDNLRGRLYVIVHVDPTSGGSFETGRSGNEILAATRAAAAARGIESSRARVYGWRGRWKMSRTPPLSTTCPAYITSTRSQACATE